MKKTLLLMFVVLSFASFAQSAQAVIYLNDTFTRATLPPWSKFLAGCGETVQITGNRLHLITGGGNCLASAGYTSVTEIENFSLSFEYEHQLNNKLLVEWINTTSSTVLIIFDTQNGLISFDILSQFFEYPTFPNIYYTFPYVFSMSPSTTYDIQIQKLGDNIKIYIDNVLIFDQSAVAFDVQWSNMALGLISTGNTFTYYDDVVVESYSPIKIIPSLTIQAVPSTPVSFGTDVTFICHPTPSELVVHLEYPFGTPVTHPYITSSLSVGSHYIYCYSEETEVYHSGSAGYVMEVTSATTTTTPSTPYGNFSWYSPIAQINATEWSESGYGWAIPFFTPIFIATIIAAFISAVSAAVGGLPVGGITFIGMLFIYSLMGIYPIWVGVVLIVLAAFIVSKWGRQVFMG